MTNDHPIGLFDSGIGGTSIWKEIRHQLPNEDTIYLADSKNAPYGIRSKDEIVSLSIKNTELLLELNCKVIVVACNTATTNAIDELRTKYSVPFIGIEPAIKPAALHSKTHYIGILATKGTLTSALFNQTVQLYGETKIVEQIGYGLVELIEAGNINSPEMTHLLKKYLAPMIRANIDYLVLGCSHYPYLVPQLKALLPAHVKIIDSGEAAARQTFRVLESTTGFTTKVMGKSIFYTNGDPSVLQKILGSQETVIKKDF